MAVNNGKYENPKFLSAWEAMGKPGKPGQNVTVQPLPVGKPKPVKPGRPKPSKGPGQLK